MSLKFIQKYPTVPLWSIHDSLVITEKHLDLLEQETKKLLNEAITTYPQIVKEI